MIPYSSKLRWPPRAAVGRGRCVALYVHGSTIFANHVPQDLDLIAVVEDLVGSQGAAHDDDDDDDDDDDGGRLRYLYISINIYIYINQIMGFHDDDDDDDDDGGRLRYLYISINIYIYVSPK